MKTAMGKWMGAAVLLAASAAVAVAQRNLAPPYSAPPAIAAMTLACGAGEPKFDMKREPSAPAPAIPAGKTLVYLIEEMPEIPFVSTKVAFGQDGTWVGETDYQSYVALLMDPGVHHFCARYQGKWALGEQGAVVLKRLNMKAGETYYLLYRGLMDRNDGEVGFFDRVDEDEGQYLLGWFQHSASKPKK